MIKLPTRVACLALGVLALAMPASAQRRAAKPAVVATGNVVNLPYSSNDAAGNQWLIYQSGWMQQRGNMPIFGQSAMMTVNGNGLQSNTNQARLDDRTGEVVFDGLNPNVAGISVTRRILVEQREGYVRYIDIFKNTAQQEQSFQFQLQTNLNYGINAASYINEPGGKQRPIGWAAQTPAGRSAVELYAGKGSKLVPTFNYQQGNNFIQVQMQITVPAGKEVAVLHVHATSTTPEAGTQTMLALKESKLLAGVPADLRRAIVNFSGGGGYIGDREILRGDVLDVVELRGAGDQLKGTIHEPSLKLSTFYGQIELSSERVIGVINIGQFRPRQLVISSEGEVFGGRLEKETIELELSSGQTTQIPLSQISRIGWRKRPGESEDSVQAPDKPILALRSGDRIAVDMPTQTIDVATRYGVLKLVPQSISAIVFASEDVGVHLIHLTDGSRFAGLVVGDQFTFRLAGGGANGQSVSLPASSLARLQLSSKGLEDPEESAPTMQLSNDDMLVGSLTGQLKLDTAFDTISLNAPEIRTLSRAKDGGTDVQIELWDQSRVSGQLQQQELTCALTSGITIGVPVLMIEQYTQPLPQPSAAMIEQIKKLVGELGADDWKQRERAEAQLISMGVAVVGVLKEMRPTVGPEAQQRIDSVLRQVDARRPKSTPSNVLMPAADE